MGLSNREKEPSFSWLGMQGSCPREILALTRGFGMTEKSRGILPPNVKPRGSKHFKAPARPGVRRGRFGSYRFLSRQQTAAGRTYDHESFNELKERLHDVKKEAEGIVKRLSGFDKL